jgi:hypothetical protein
LVENTGSVDDAFNVGGLGLHVVIFGGASDFFSGRRI